MARAMTWPTYTPACIADVAKLLRKGGSLSAYRANPKVGVGPKEGSQAYALEREIERKFKVKHAVGVNSGTAALHAGLQALGVKDRQVIVSPYTFSATVSAIVLAGGTPVFADVDPYTFCITPETVKPHITRCTAAILPVHLFGYFQDLEGFKEFGLPVIEDACQSVGAQRGGSYSGSVGVAGAFSFNGSKNIPAGEGGALVTNDSKIAEKARLFVNHEENFGSRDVGVNYRMHELVALLARHGLRDLDERNERRRELVRQLPRAIPDLKEERLIADFGGRCDSEHVYYVAPFVVWGDRAAFIKRCAKRGVTIGAGYIQPPLHHYQAFRRYATRKLPVVDELSAKTLCLLYDFTPDKPLSYARHVAKVVAEALR